MLRCDRREVFFRNTLSRYSAIIVEVIEVFILARLSHFLKSVFYGDKNVRGPDVWAP